MPKFGTIVAALAAGGVATMTAVAVITSGSDSVSVVRVIDGDTIDALLDGEERRIRLLNVDTPEMGRDGAPAECLAEEATAFLRSVLPAGTEVSLQYDEETTDRYGRDLAGVYLGGNLINAQIAREGYGVAVQFGANSRFHGSVSAAEDEARAAGKGIHALPEECSVAEQTENLTSQVTALLAASVAAMGTTDIDLHETRLLALLSEVRQLQGATKNPSDFENAAFDGYEKERRALADLEAQLKAREDELESRREEVVREERAAREAAAAEAEADRLRVEQERRDRERPVQPVVPAPHIAPAPAPQPAPIGGGGYTGCRAYGGNYALTSIDDKGRPYAKIDCATKVQIG
ncbi:thermonuclease family protein [Corynebacterium sp.]|uniref:thermonuclease family protein n=1 Tax=Corynebacterium sp. TaxID=1720 RepID=UPI0026E08371|nr:thermonuclease family protein [Corynebacterium sp.]MDO5512660.1 thermonuclease family protein [Corynebacterium sp.]